MNTDTTFLGLFGSSSGDSRTSLRDDQRGAVMLTGLFMSCFLIGALWFLVGIGDTLVFRDKMQEAADHGAFSSAALHAKGMNFISLCNLVMLVGTVIHIVLGIISDIKCAQMIVTCLATLGVGCPAAIANFEVAYRKWDGYFNKMSKAFKAIHVAQQTASYAYPAMGVIEAYQTGAKYGGDRRTGPVRVLAVSSSLIPGGAVRSFGKAAGGMTGAVAGAVLKEGLPVEARPFGELCKKVVSVAVTSSVNLIGLGKSVSATSGISGRVLMVFNSIVGTLLELRYCNPTELHVEPFGPGWDSFWGEDGPYVAYGQAGNGNVWMQTWAINVTPALNDTSESHVGIAAKQYAKYTKPKSDNSYFAQAEFYFDCDSGWYTARCNYEDMATFAIKWRARMRRFELPALTTGLVGASMEALQNLPASKKFKNGIPEKLGDLLGASSLGRGVLSGITSSLINQIETYTKNSILTGVGHADPTLDKFGLTSFH